LFAISAPSGTGKTTLVKRLLQEAPDLGRSVSCTTRSPRAGEEDGRDYHFIDEKTFREMERQNRFFEWEEVHGAFYGTPRETLVKRRQEGKDTILDIDTRGALNLKKEFPDSCLIFLLPPSLSALEERLRNRKTEEEVSFKRRMENARREIAEKDKFDYVIINDDVNRAYEEMRRIIDSVRGHS
jgi:guanylate kinase